MKTATLEAFGVDERLINMWIEAGQTELLPIQTQAIKQGKILEGGNAVIFSPTSSGKTFVGEMAAVQTALQDRRVIYLVPQKALAEEKYREIRDKYSRLGLRVVISTRDHREHDRDIRKGRFDIAVIVFEKMHSLMVADPTILADVGLVVVDELQMLADETRGPALELLLTKVLQDHDRPQLICLSAVLGNARQVASWIGGTLCEEHRRPVELRKGVLYKGRFHYVEHNSGSEGVEELGPCLEGAEDYEILVEQVRALVRRGEQCLVFCRSKRDCMATASAIAAVLSQPAADSVRDELSNLEESNGRDCLMELLEQRVAYHNADLDWDQRQIIERGFRSGEIIVVCATSTLAMGINMPARNVFIDTRRWQLHPSGKWCEVTITQGEYENSSGRAGRLGLEKDYGRAIIIGDSEFALMKYMGTYVKGKLEDLRPALAEVPLSSHVLNLVASGMARSEKSIRDILLRSYTGSLYWCDDQEKFVKRLGKAVQRCLKGDLITAEGEELAVTEVGEVAAASGITVDTAIKVASFVRDHADVAEEIEPLEVLWALTGTEDGEATHFNLSTVESKSGEYLALFGEAIGRLPASAKLRMKGTLESFPWTYENVKRAKKTLLMNDWISGEATRTIESRYYCYSGSVYGLGGEIAWLADALAGIAKALEWPAPSVKRLEALTGQLMHGLQADGLPLASIHVRGFRRGRIAALVANGYDTAKKLAEAPFDELRKLVTKPVAEAIVKQLNKEDAPAREDAARPSKKRKASQPARLVAAAKYERPKQPPTPQALLTSAPWRSTSMGRRGKGVS